MVLMRQFDQTVEHNPGKIAHPNCSAHSGNRLDAGARVNAVAIKVFSGALMATVGLVGQLVRLGLVILAVCGPERMVEPVEPVEEMVVLGERVTDY